MISCHRLSRITFNLMIVMHSDGIASFILKKVQMACIKLFSNSQRALSIRKCTTFDEAHMDS